MIRWAALLLLAISSSLGCSADEPGPDLTPPTASESRPQLGTLEDVVGAVELRRPGIAFWERASNGTSFRAGDWVKTGPQASVRLRFEGGAQLAVEQSALVVVEAPEPSLDAGEAEPLVVINRGVARGVAQLDGGVAPVRVRSGGSTHRIVPLSAEPVSFRLRATDRGTEIAVTEGSGAVERNEQRVELGPGRATVATATALSDTVEVPEFPVSVAPGIDARAVFEPNAWVRLSWKPVPKVTSYLLEVARDLSFTVDVRRENVEGTSFDLRPESRGLYAWRVASQGAGGVLSEFGFARRIYFEAELPTELLLTPEEGEVFGYQTQAPTILFQWRAAAGTTSYRLAVSKRTDPLDRPALVETVEGQRVETTKLLAGEYWWGVYTRPGMKPIFLAPRRLVVKQMPKPKVTSPKAIQWQ